MDTTIHVAPGDREMESLPTRNSAPIPDRIPIHDAHLLATLWEEQELAEWLLPLKIISEHIDLQNADLTIVAWEKLLSLVEDLDRRYALNISNARNNAVHLGIELPGDDEGIDALSAVLAHLYVGDTSGGPGTKIHPARHLVCNIGVLRACTSMKTAYSLMKSTHAMEPTAGLLELVSRLDRHRQSLLSEINGYQIRTLMEISEQSHASQAMELLTELSDFKQQGMAYWKIESHVIP